MREVSPDQKYSLPEENSVSVPSPLLGYFLYVKLIEKVNS